MQSTNRRNTLTVGMINIIRADCKLETFKSMYSNHSLCLTPSFQSLLRVTYPTLYRKVINQS